MTTTEAPIEETEPRWASRKALAFTIRAFLFVVPLAGSVAVTIACTRLIARPPSLLGTVGWWVAISAAATAALLLLQRQLKKFLPVVALLRMTLVFPDNAPSRFRMALRQGTVKQFQRQAEAGNLSQTAQASAETLLRLSTEIGQHDRLTRGHSERVRAYSNLIAEEMGIAQRDRDLLHWAALLHDVGKLNVPPEILNKNGRPTNDEWDILKQHPAHATRHLAPLAGWLGEWRFAASQHHERWDGAGYPVGLQGDEISLAGRIVAVADAYDTITSVRSYKKASSPAEGREEIARCSGTQFDPAVVRAFLAISTGELKRIVGPLGWLAQVPILATVPSAAAPVANVVTSTVAAGASAVTMVASGAAALPPSDIPVELASAIVAEAEELDGQFVLTFEQSALQSAARTPSPTPNATSEGSPTPTLTATSTPTPGATLVIEIEVTPTPISSPLATPTPVTAVAAATPPPLPTAAPDDPTATPTPAPTAPPPPTATPASPPAPTSTPTVTPAPTATPTPAGPPVAERYYFDSLSTGGGPTDSTLVLPFANTPPTGSGLPNYDQNRDSEVGLLLIPTDAGLAETDQKESQFWASDATGATLRGPASATFYAAPEEYDWETGVTIVLGLQACNATFTSCETLASDTDTATSPILSSFGILTYNFGTVDHTFTAARPYLAIKSVVADATDEDVWVAFDTSVYPAHLDITGYGI